MKTRLASTAQVLVTNRRVRRIARRPSTSVQVLESPGIFGEAITTVSLKPPSIQVCWMCSWGFLPSSGIERMRVTGSLPLYLVGVQMAYSMSKSPNFSDCIVTLPFTRFGAFLE